MCRESFYEALGSEASRGRGAHWRKRAILFSIPFGVWLLLRHANAATGR